MEFKLDSRSEMEFKLDAWSEMKIKLDSRSEMEFKLDPQYTVFSKNGVFTHDWLAPFFFRVRSDFLRSGFPLCHPGCSPLPSPP